MVFSGSNLGENEGFLFFWFSGIFLLWMDDCEVCVFFFVFYGWVGRDF